MTSGILLLDKPQGLSSSAAVQKVRRALGRIKAGHTGSLDPLATGMLPICLGEATKVAGYLLDGDKTYAFTARFGHRTTTGDLEGEEIDRASIPDDLEGAIGAAIPAFTGEISQVPPMYSAIKRDGQPLYRLARQGIEIPREARRVTIRSLELQQVAGTEVTCLVRCSKGTYIRTLAEDMARAVGSAAHLVMLRRLAVAPFEGAGMVTLAQLEAAPGAVTLLPSDAALPHLPRLELDGEATRRLGMGQAVSAGPAPAGLLRLYAPGGCFLGIGSGDSAGTVKPVRLFNNLGAPAT